MVIVLILLAGLFLAGTMLLIRNNRKLKSQAKMMAIQGREIEQQLKALRQQNILLEDLNKEKHQIIGVVSHDLKGPFNRIFALIQLMSLTSENFTADQRDYLGKIHQIVADGLAMVRNLLDNRRLEDKGLEPILEKLNASSIATSIVKNYRVLSDKKKIEILLDAPAQASMMADKIYLHRIMDNLLTNAIKFSPSGKKIWVNVRTEGENTVISVKDEGPGISAEDRKKLFQKYQRLTPRPTAGESSTGLGLYLIHAMVGKMEGKVLCESVEGSGATFSVHLKAAS